MLQISATSTESEEDGSMAATLPPNMRFKKATELPVKQRLFSKGISAYSPGKLQWLPTKVVLHIILLLLLLLIMMVACCFIVAKVELSVSSTESEEEESSVSISSSSKVADPKKSVLKKKITEGTCSACILLQLDLPAYCVKKKLNLELCFFDHFFFNHRISQINSS